MKKLFVTFFALFAIGFCQAQDISFGATAGYVTGEAKVKTPGFDASASEGGFYVGAVADISISDAFHVQPELLFTAIEDLNSLSLPIMAKYYVIDKLNIQAGPTLSYLLEDSLEDFSNFGISLGGGAGFDFNDNWFAQMRYNFQVNNYYTGDVSDVSSKLNTFTLGVGYKF
jgi:opacity protein-like surface antigen